MLHYGLQHLMAQTDDDELTPLTADHVAALLNRQSHGITYKAGNAAAVTSSDGRPAIIVHCVDTSGAWTSRGLFGALSRRSLSVEEAYACMRPNQDLKLGQAHCIPIDSNTFVCLLVVQSYLHQRQKRTHKTLSLRLNALQVALKAVAAHARRLDATIHMPRLGAGTPGFNWYAVERLIRKHLTDGAT
ncbi:hypothetical protein DYB30_014131, partial [Aphanomyces astaci]